MFVTFSAAEI